MASNHPSRSRAPRRSRPAAAVVLALLVCLGTPAETRGQDAPEAGADSPIAALGTWGSWAALAIQDGRVILLDVTDGRRFEWQAPAEPVVALALVPMDEAADLRAAEGPDSPAAGARPLNGPVPRLVVAVPSGTGKGSILQILDGATGRELRRTSVHSRPVHILPSAGAREIYVITRDVPEIVRKRQTLQARQGWALVRAVFDKTPRRMAVATSIAGEVLGAAISPAGDRIYVAQEGHIRSFVTGPLRSSWMLRSPGRNRAIVPFVSGRVLVGRGRELATFDPDHLPGRDAATGKISTDDSIARVKLPIQAWALSVSFSGNQVAILGDQGRNLALLEMDSLRLRQVDHLPPTRAAVFHPEQPAIFLFGPDGGLTEMRLGGLERGPATLAEAPRRETGGERSPPSADARAAAPAGEEAAGPGSVGPVDPAAGGPAPPGPGPDREGTRGTAEPGAPAPGGPGSGGSGAGPEADPVEPQGKSGEAEEPGPGAAGTAGEPGETEQAEPPADSPRLVGLIPELVELERLYSPPEPVLAGRVTGESALVSELILYGPDSILREHSRITLSGDGTFQVPLPPPGRYRLLPAGLEGAQLAVSPPLRRLTVGGKALMGLDFEVKGKIQGRFEE